MAKKSMKVKYKPIKREKNKINKEEKIEDQAKSFVRTLLGVLAFMLVCYLLVLGMKKIGVFDKRYTKPQSEEAIISHEYISVGTILNREESTYYVLFDNYKNTITKDSYINGLLDSQDKYRVYKVDMNKNENKKYMSDTPNKDIKNIGDIRVSEVTLLKVSNGKIVDFISGNDNIEEYLK